MDRLGPTVDLYVQMLVEENQRLRVERERARKSAWEARQSRDRWKVEALASRRRMGRQVWDYNHRQRLKAAA